MISKLSELLVSGHHRTGFVDVSMSPRSPLDLKIQSPRGLRNYDFGAVGLGIVAALEKSGDHNGNNNNNPFLAKHAIVSTSSPSYRSSAPIPVTSARDSDGFDSDEDYTFVTCHGPNDKSFTTVYYDVDGGDHHHHHHHQIGRALRRSNDKGIFNIATTVTPSLSFASDFLSCCNLCNKKLHGKDIFMYRGEKAFCSSECRSSQILMDERKEQCRSEAPRSVVDHASSSPYSRGQIFSTGIFAI